MAAITFPLALDPSLVGEYSATAFGGGGFVWDAVLEYRIWCSPRRGAPDEAEGDDYYYAFDSYDGALAYSKEHAGADAPIALILQEEYIDEPEVGKYVHMKKRRVTEWPVEFLTRPRRTENTIPEFLSPDAPTNRLEVLKGTAE